MLPDTIDDLFRQQLDGHATPPAPDLWARLQLPAAETDPVDATFQAGLRGHATPLRRELWERLEDEHLRPQPRRRVVAWWQLSAAAVLLLGLLLGGGLLWRNGYLGSSGGGLAQSGGAGAQRTTGQATAVKPAKNTLAQSQPLAQTPELVANTALRLAAAKKNQKKVATQATAFPASTSSTPIATTTRPRRPAPAVGSQQAQRQQPDAATGPLARREGQSTPSNQPQPTQLPAPGPAHPSDAPALAAAPPAAPEVIEVEVRRGAARPAPAAETAVADATPAPARRGLRLGRLLRQADHLVHGEPVSLAEATGLPETMTVQARLGGRLISKTIQL